LLECRGRGREEVFDQTKKKKKNKKKKNNLIKEAR
jgi:hypothetical protein